MTVTTTFAAQYLAETARIAALVDVEAIERLATTLAGIRAGGGRLFFLGVGGGDIDRNVSPNLVRAVEYARRVGATVVGIVGKDGGFTATAADACVIVPTVNPSMVTAHTEAFQAVIWHLLVFHPLLQTSPAKWEGMR